MARRHLGYSYGESLSDLMNGPIRKKLGIIPNNVIWGGKCTVHDSCCAQYVTVAMHCGLMKYFEVLGNLLHSLIAIRTVAMYYS